jgi:hypothetical protein
MYIGPCTTLFCEALTIQEGQMFMPWPVYSQMTRSFRFQIFHILIFIAHIL